MSPRSEEFMAQARERHENARADLTSGYLPGAVSAAYYAMLYAARAALSERDLYAKTHGGTWSLFARTFVEGGEFDRELHRAATAAQEVRQRGDYEAEPPDDARAAEIVEGSGRFIAAIGEMLDG